MKSDDHPVGQKPGGFVSHKVFKYSIAGCDLLILWANFLSLEAIELIPLDLTTSLITNCKVCA